MNERQLFLEDKLQVSAFKSAESLKQAIRKKISKKFQNGWQFNRLSLHGRYLILKFKPGESCNPP